MMLKEIREKGLRIFMKKLNPNYFIKGSKDINKYQEEDPGKAPKLFQQKQEPGKKFDEGKLRFDLLSVHALTGTTRVLTFGAQKYGERNWEAGMSWSRCFAALLRHVFAWWMRKDKDDETGLNHLHHASCCLHFLQHYVETKTGKDDRPCKK